MKRRKGHRTQTGHSLAAVKRGSHRKMASMLHSESRAWFRKRMSAPHPRRSAILGEAREYARGIAKATRAARGHSRAIKRDSKGRFV